MVYRSIFSALALSAVTAGLAMPAWADIGGVGAPQRGGNAPQEREKARNDKEQEDTQDTAEAAETRTPLLVIRFNKSYVNLAGPIRTAVRASEAAKAGVQYDVVSFVPSGGSEGKNRRLNQGASSNVSSVVQELQRNGVSPSRISTSSKPSSAINSQEVHVYIE